MLGLIAAVFHAGSMWMFIGLYALSIVYSLSLKRLVPLVATPAWCVAMTILVLWPDTFSFVHYALVFLFLYSRELLLDLRDVSADNRFCWMPSLPAVAGPSIHLIMGLIFVAIALIARAYDFPTIAISGLVFLPTYFGYLLFAKDSSAFSRRMALLMRVFMLNIFAL